MELRVYIISALLTITHCSRFYPVVQPSLRRSYKDADRDKPLFRSLLLDSTGRFVYAGARSSVYKFDMQTNDVTTEKLQDLSDVKPNFNDM